MLITGDGDFYTLARYINDRNKLLNITVPNKNSYSALLRKFKRVYVSEWKKKIEHINNKDGQTHRANLH